MNKRQAKKRMKLNRIKNRMLAMRSLSYLLEECHIPFSYQLIRYARRTDNYLHKPEMTFLKYPIERAKKHHGYWDRW